MNPAKYLVTLSLCFAFRLCAYSQDQTVNGNLYVSPNHQAPGYSPGLLFTGNTDDVWFKRYNYESNKSEFRVNFSDDNLGEDKFTIGTTYCADGQWRPNFSVINNGNVGIGTTTPRGLLQVTNERDYFVNRCITGMTEDAQGTNYLLLHKMYSGALMDETYVMGQLSGIRGNAYAWNRKWVVNVNTASAYNSDRGSLISYMEPARLVSLTYQGVKYLAIEITNSSSLYSFSFTGYAANEAFQIVYDQDVTNVEDFTNTDPLTIQGSLAVGTNNPQGYKLAVGGSMIAESIKVKLKGQWPDYVFTGSYRPKSLPEIEAFVKENKHLPDMPSSEEVKRDGLDVEDINARMLKKIEELTLLLIEKDKQLKTQEERLTKIEKFLSGKSTK